MYCTVCGAQFPDDSTFCTSCGAPVSAMMPQPEPQNQFIQPQQDYYQPTNQYIQPQDPEYSLPPEPGFNQYMAAQNSYEQPASINNNDESKICPGKEITGMIFGIVSVMNASLSSIYAFILFLAVIVNISTISYSSSSSSETVIKMFVCTILFILQAIIYAIVALVLNGKVKKEADIITNKIKAGKVMAIIGIALSSLSALSWIISLIIQIIAVI